MTTSASVHSGLSAGTSAGIGVGVGVLVIVLAILGLIICRRRRRRSRGISELGPMYGHAYNRPQGTDFDSGTVTPSFDKLESDEGFNSPLLVEAPSNEVGTELSVTEPVHELA